MGHFRFVRVRVARHRVGREAEILCIGKYNFSKACKANFRLPTSKRHTSASNVRIWSNYGSLILSELYYQFIGVARHRVE